MYNFKVRIFLKKYYVFNTIFNDSIDRFSVYFYKKAVVNSSLYSILVN